MSDVDREDASASEAQEVENYLETYKTIADWIRFADAKAAAVLTVCGVLAGLLIPRLKVYLDTASGVEHPLPGWDVIVMVVFLAWIITLAVSGILAFRCIIPYRQKGRHPALESDDPAAHEDSGHRTNCLQNGWTNDDVLGMLVEVHAPSPMGKQTWVLGVSCNLGTNIGTAFPELGNYGLASLIGGDDGSRSL